MNKALVFAAVVFAWMSGAVLDGIARFPVKTDYYLFSGYGGPVLYFAPMLLLLALLVAADYYLWRPARGGLLTCLVALAATAIHSVASLWLTLRDIPGARDLYTRGREIRGLPIREEGLDVIFSSSSLIAITAATLAVYALCAFFLARNRSYFEPLGDDN